MAATKLERLQGLEEAGKTKLPQRIAKGASAEKLRSAEASVSGKTPIGVLERFEGSVYVVSKKSFQGQYIPSGTRKFIDVITGEIEEV